MTSGIVYPAISGHPDIFMFAYQHKLIVAPNTPAPFVDALRNRHIRFQSGIRQSKGKYPDTTSYNVACSKHYCIHHRQYTDPAVLRHIEEKTFIPVPQAYSRCNTIALRKDAFITSDKGIYKVLKKHNVDALYVAPQGILLPPYDYGFIGGTAGIVNDTVYFLGTLKYFPEGEKIKHFLQARAYRIVELYDGPLYDGGGILFVEPSAVFPRKG